VRVLVVVWCYLLVACVTTDPDILDTIDTELDREERAKESETVRVYRLKRPIEMYNLKSPIPPWEQDKILDYLDSLPKRDQELLFDRFIPEYKRDALRMRDGGLI
jgi:hypothetical protein